MTAWRTTRRCCGRRTPPCCLTGRRSRSAGTVPCGATAGRPIIPIRTTPSTTPARRSCGGDRRWRRISRRTLRIVVCVFPSCWGRWMDSSMISSSAGCTTGGWTRPTAWPGSSTGRWPRCCHGPPRRNGSAAHT